MHVSEVRNEQLIYTTYKDSRLVYSSGIIIIIIN